MHGRRVVTLNDDDDDARKSVRWQRVVKAEAASLRQESWSVPRSTLASAALAKFQLQLSSQPRLSTRRQETTQRPNRQNESLRGFLLRPEDLPWQGANLPSSARDREREGDISRLIGVHSTGQALRSW